MTPEQRQSRLTADLESLRALKKQSSILDFECVGECPDAYTLGFRGVGLARDLSGQRDVERVDQHKIEIRLPFSYPDSPPDIRWVTPILHPNVSFSGFINVKDIGLQWEPDLGLDVVCERLWDVVRLAYLNLEQATNYSARNWFADQRQFPLPVDVRPLRDKQVSANSNIVHYERRGGSRVVLPTATSTHSETFFIGEDTPTPALPSRAPGRRPPSSDDDVLYIE